MITLALDTCLGACSVAVLRDDSVVAAISEPMTRGHQERLAPMAKAVMAQADTPFSALDRIGVTVGPGSFTGLRVGIAFAKGLGLGLDRPCVGVGSLEALAASVVGDGLRASVIDAGRGNLFLQIFEGARALTAPDMLAIDTAAARLTEVCGGRALTLVGPGARLLADATRAAQRAELVAPLAEAVARLAAGPDRVTAKPLYLRAPDALPKAARPA